MGRRRNRVRLSPAWLPYIRDKIVDEHRRTLAELSRLTRGSYRGSLTSAWNEFDSLAAAPLWWVSRDMTFLAQDTARHGPLPPVPAAPSGCGLVVFEGGLDYKLEHEGARLRIDAVFWITKRFRNPFSGVRGERFQVVPLTADRGFVSGRPVPLRIIPEPLSEHREGILVDVLHCVWALSSKPTVCRCRRAVWEAADGPRPIALSGANTPEVSMLVLREHDHHGGRGVVGDGSGWERGVWSHRWIVRGHWKRQAYGAGRALRRDVWIPPHVKGPVGLPLKRKPQVMVWRH